ncbi:MAG TPA: ThiF family adenylyltransferase [Bacilli bacterium]
MNPCDPEKLPKYSRQTLFAPIGLQGQTKLAQAKAAVVGVGALGTALANYLVRAGVGYVRLIDRDVVEESNLNRQLLFGEDDASCSRPKAEAAAHALRRVNSAVQIEPVTEDLHAFNAARLLADMDIILDGTDNFSTRYLLNDVSLKFGIPWVYGGAVGARSVSISFVPRSTPCFRCLYPAMPGNGVLETCDTAGVIGPAAGLTASVQAAEALKILVGDSKRLRPSLIFIDLWSNEFRHIDVSGAKRKDCPACAEKNYEFLDAQAKSDLFQRLCGRNAVQVFPAGAVRLDLKSWADRLAHTGKVKLQRYMAQLQTDDGLRLLLFSDGRAIVEGTEDIEQARAIYRKYVGT